VQAVYGLTGVFVEGSRRWVFIVGCDERIVRGSKGENGGEADGHKLYEEGT